MPYSTHEQQNIYWRREEVYVRTQKIWHDLILNYVYYHIPMQEEKISNIKIKRKTASLEVMQKRALYLYEYYSDKARFFNELFIMALHSNIDFSIKRRKKWWEYWNYKISKDYNEIILTCLEIQKWIYN